MKSYIVEYNRIMAERRTALSLHTRFALIAIAYQYKTKITSLVDECGVQMHKKVPKVILTYREWENKLKDLLNKC